ncbi:hypothetical protein BKA70DRAFT_1233627 [Coprinopsis sp. MPI-PUGE-AT-0042]|nr:hypothetical protein BKA70DRAFT_1233627 [Coprinopsis sp. MPI-PUGE-AT-0042]
MEPIASTSADIAKYLRPRAEVVGGAIPLVGSTSGVHIMGETVNFIEGNQHHQQQYHYHHHNHAPLQPTFHDIPAILDQVPNYRDIHIANLGRATEGTGPIFAEWEQFCEWISVQGVVKTMWGSGMPGARKTIFASIVINEVEARAGASEHPICVGYIYFRYSDHTTATVRDFLLVLVKQTIERHADCLPIFNEVFARHIREKTLLSESELVQLLRRFAEVIAGMFYFLDALDEAPPDVQFNLLKKLSTLDVKIFITSRPLANLDSCLPGAHRFSIRAQDRDLELHIAKEIEFLHASLQLDALRGCANVYAVEKTLEGFPRQIQDVYQQTWKRIEAQAPDTVVIAKNALIWVLCAKRSLKIEELRHAVATCPVTHRFDRNRLVDEATLMGFCRGLMNMEERTNIVRSVHYTAKDVVKGLVSRSSHYLHTLPALVCIALLTECGFQQTRATRSDRGALTAPLSTEPLLAYAYWNWSIHAHKSLDDTSLVGRLSQFVQGCTAFPPGLIWGTSDILKPLHMAAYFDFPLSVAGSAHLRDPNHPTAHRGQTPLMLATMTNSLSAMRELLCLPGILVNAADKDGGIPLVYAARRNEEASLSLLLTHPKINVNAPDSDGDTALMVGNPEEIVTLLLAQPKIKPNLVDSNGYTALMEVVQVLLADPRVKVSLKTKDGKTALDMVGERYWGDYGPCDQIIELLRTDSDLIAKEEDKFATTLPRDVLGLDMNNGKGGDECQKRAEEQLGAQSHGRAFLKIASLVFRALLITECLISSYHEHVQFVIALVSKPCSNDAWILQPEHQRTKTANGQHPDVTARVWFQRPAKSILPLHAFIEPLHAFMLSFPADLEDHASPEDDWGPCSRVGQKGRMILRWKVCTLRIHLPFLVLA